MPPRRVLADLWPETQDAMLALSEKHPRTRLGGRTTYLARTTRAAQESALRSLACLHRRQRESAGDVDGALAVPRADLATPPAYSTVPRFLRVPDRPRGAFANAELACRVFPCDWHLKMDHLECYERDGWAAEVLALRRLQFERGPTLERCHEVT